VSSHGKQNVKTSYPETKTIECLQKLSAEPDKSMSNRPSIGISRIKLTLGVRNNSAVARTRVQHAKTTTLSVCTTNAPTNDAKST
jgi:hypothetical protein